MTNHLLSQLDQVVVVTTEEAGALYAARRTPQNLEDAGFGRDRARLVLNQVSGNATEIEDLATRLMNEPSGRKPRRSLLTALSACTSWTSR